MVEDLRFRVLPRTKPDPTGIRYPLFRLRRSPWDDYGFRATFELIYFPERAEEVPIGEVKIVARDQNGGATPMPEKTFASLNHEYCSLGTELEYYENLIRVVGKGIAKSVLTALRDAAINSEISKSFENDNGYNTSLLRYTPARKALQEAKYLFQTGGETKTATDLAFYFNTSVGGEEFIVDFDFAGPDVLPGRINVLIGANGSGKTKLLSNLALAALGEAYSGAFEYNGTPHEEVVFGRILAFSYSAFDSFDLPGKSVTQKRQFDKSKIAQGYRYCGIRDLTADDSRSLKTSLKIQGDFRRALKLCISNDRWPGFWAAFKTLTAEASFSGIGEFALSPLEWEDDNIDREEFVAGLRSAFPALSTGHKFVLLMIAQLASYVRPQSLVLFDEPEAHLHPPLLAAFLRSVRSLLDGNDSYAIVATHSPVVLQETPAQYVRIIFRNVDRTDVLKPELETYGEDIGTITREVFGLNTKETDFRVVLKYLAATYQLDEIEDLFVNGLSSQARSFILAEKMRG